MCVARAFGFPGKESDHLSKRPVNPKQKALSHDVQ